MAGFMPCARLSLEIAPGECVAFAGRNGSGKTTLLRIAAQLVRPSAGKFDVFAGANGRVARDEEHGVCRSRHWFTTSLPPKRICCCLPGCWEFPEPAKRVESLLHDVGLFERRESLVRTFSRGMRQRVSHSARSAA